MHFPHKEDQIGSTPIDDIERNSMWPFSKKTPKKEVSSKNMENLTEYEGYLIKKGEFACCPDCGGFLVEGPEGGCSLNTLCEKCGSEFNLTFWGDSIIGERISDRGPRDVGDRKWAYRNNKIRINVP